MTQPLMTQPEQQCLADSALAGSASKAVLLAAWRPVDMGHMSCTFADIHRTKDRSLRKGRHWICSRERDLDQVSSDGLFVSTSPSKVEVDALVSSFGCAASSGCYPAYDRVAHLGSSSCCAVSARVNDAHGTGMQSFQRRT